MCFICSGQAHNLPVQGSQWPTSFFLFFSFSSFEKSVTDPGPVPAGPAGLNSVPACCNQLKVTQRAAICALIGLF